MSEGKCTDQCSVLKEEAFDCPKLRLAKATAQSEKKRLVEAIEKANNELIKTRMQLNIAQGREVKLCGDHHGKGYDNADCILCNFEQRRKVGNKQLVEALKDLLKALDNCPGEFNYPPLVEDKAREALKAAGEEIK